MLRTTELYSFPKSFRKQAQQIPESCCNQAPTSEPKRKNLSHFLGPIHTSQTGNQLGFRASNKTGRGVKGPRQNLLNNGVASGFSFVSSHESFFWVCMQAKGASR